MSVHSSVQTDELELMLPNNEQSHRNRNRSQFSTLPASLHSLRIVNSNREGCMTRNYKKCLFLFICLTAFSVIGVIFFAYYCQGSNSLCSIPPAKTYFKYIASDLIGHPINIASKYNNLPTFQDITDKDFQFDIEDNDVIVFLHMQKTGGTKFGKHLVKNLKLKRNCMCHRKVKKRCTCLRPGTNSTWLFSRYSTGWKCGLHADWTELTSCVDDAMDEIDNQFLKRRYFYITFLREPIHRFLSELRHVQRGATWKRSRLFCDGRYATEEEVPFCYDGDDWSDVSLKEFLGCKSNLAINRQTRMLADLSLVNCYDTNSMNVKERDMIMLASAKTNLHRMAFFGLTEFQEMSQYLFEETFNLKFKVRFMQLNESLADDALSEIEPSVVDEIKKANHLDIQLYEYAETLLKNRFTTLKKLDKHFDEHFALMGDKHKFSWKKLTRKEKLH